MEIFYNGEIKPSKRLESSLNETLAPENFLLHQHIHLYLEPSIPDQHQPASLSWIFYVYGHDTMTGWPYNVI